MPLTNIKNPISAALGQNSYGPTASNWYKSLPYAFLATEPDGQKRIFNLPINPSNLNIVTHFATNIIATIGGTVEEHGPQRYFDITIQGTTGIAPQFSREQLVQGNVALNTSSVGGRQSYSPSFNIGDYTGGFFAKTAGQIQNIANRAKDILSGSRKHESGVSDEASGYVAFHNFYKFLLENKQKLAGASSGGSISSAVRAGINQLTGGALGDNKLVPLKFISYKDNQEYTGAILRFELTRSAENPMLYNYSIQFRAYALSSVGFSDISGTSDRKKTLGLDGGPSALSKFSGKISGAKGAISAVSGAFKGLGR